ncbi:MAG: hypothetical protein R3C10_04250 [Pirellulales bacterium]
MSRRTEAAGGRERNAPADRSGNPGKGAAAPTPREIAIVWSIEDVQHIRPDLGDERAYEVLAHSKKWHDADIGINWDVLYYAAEALYPAEAHGLIHALSEQINNQAKEG